LRGAKRHSGLMIRGGARDASKIQGIKSTKFLPKLATVCSGRPGAWKMLKRLPEQRQASAIVQYLTLRAGLNTPATLHTAQNLIRRCDPVAWRWPVDYAFCTRLQQNDMCHKND